MSHFATGELPVKQEPSPKTKFPTVAPVEALQLPEIWVVSDRQLPTPPSAGKLTSKWLSPNPFMESGTQVVPSPFTVLPWQTAAAQSASLAQDEPLREHVPLFLQVLAQASFDSHVLLPREHVPAVGLQISYVYVATPLLAALAGLKFFSANTYPAGVQTLSAKVSHVSLSHTLKSGGVTAALAGIITNPSIASIAAHASTLRKNLFRCILTPFRTYVAVG